MEEVIKAFGIDLRLIIIQLVNFALLAAALGYFLYQPVLKLLRDREERITQGLKDAELAATAKAEAHAEKQVVLAAAHHEATEVANRAKQAATAQSSEIINSAQEKAGLVIKEAELKSEQLKQQALSESEKEVAKLAILATEKLLKQAVN